MGGGSYRTVRTRLSGSTARIGRKGETKKKRASLGEEIGGETQRRTKEGLRVDALGRAEYSYWGKGGVRKGEKNIEEKNGKIGTNLRGARILITLHR